MVGGCSGLDTSGVVARAFLQVRGPSRASVYQGGIWPSRCQGAGPSRCTYCGPNHDGQGLVGGIPLFLGGYEAGLRTLWGEENSSGM